MKLFSKNFNLCDHNSPTLQTDRQTDRQTTCDRNTALCTKVHRTVKTADFTHPSLVWWARSGPSGEPLEFLDETYRAKTRGMGLPYGENFIILTSTVFVWSTRLTERRTGVRYSIYAVAQKNKTLQLTNWEEHQNLNKIRKLLRYAQSKANETKDWFNGLLLNPTRKQTGVYCTAPEHTWRCMSAEY